MRVENLAQPAMKGFIAPLLFPASASPVRGHFPALRKASLRRLLPRLAKRTKPPPSPAHSASRSVGTSIWLASLTRMLWITITGI